MAEDFASRYESARREVLGELARALGSVDPASLERLKDDILAADQVFFVGVGRVMLSLQCICKRLAHLGVNAHYVGEITEPHLNKEDLLIVGSGSGSVISPT